MKTFYIENFISHLIFSIMFILRATPLYTQDTIIREQDQNAIIADDPNIIIGELNNGLTYYIRKNSIPERYAELRLVVDAGSILENDNQRGTAHFIEHMAFRGTTNFSEEEINQFFVFTGQRFGENGIAYTGYDETVYKITLPVSDNSALETGVRILADWAHCISFDSEKVDKERSVIIEELRLDAGARSRMWNRQAPVLYRNSRYADRTPLGDLDVINRITSEDLLRFYRDWYRPELMAVVAVGDFDCRWIENSIKSNFGKLENRRKCPIRIRYNVPDHDESLYAPASDSEYGDTLVRIYYKHDPEEKKRYQDRRRSLVDRLYIGMLNERLRELSSSSATTFTEVGAVILRKIRAKEIHIFAARPKENKILPCLETLLTEAERIKRHGFIETELVRQKKVQLNLLQTEYRERKKIRSTSIAEACIKNFLEGEPISDVEADFHFLRSCMPEITLDEVNQRSAYWLSDRNRVVLANAPRKNGIVLPDHDQVLNLCASLDEKSLSPYEEAVSDAPLFSILLKGSKIIKRERIAELGLSVLLLENGIRVLLKPTEFKEEEVLFSAHSPGGHSLVPDCDFVSAVTAADIVLESGAGSFSAGVLEKLLAGKTVRVRPWIGGVSEGLEGQSSITDLETLFQLIYLYIAKPKFDPQAFRNYRERLEVRAENRQLSPTTFFSDTVHSICSRDHFRTRAWTKEVLSEMNLEASTRIYLDRFGDASDFTFIFVGSFTIEQIEPLITLYLGSLPSGGRIEDWRDTDFRPVKGVIKREITGGSDDKSLVQFNIFGPLTWNLSNRLHILTLENILKHTLRQTLREEAGATYAIWVDSEGVHYPAQWSTFKITFSCDPAKRNVLTDLLAEEISRLRSEGPDREIVDRIRRDFLRERKMSLQTNLFWKERLKFFVANRIDPRSLLDYEDRLNQLSVESIQKAAQTYLDMKNYVRIDLVPASGERNF